MLSTSRRQRILERSTVLLMVFQILLRRTAAFSLRQSSFVSPYSVVRGVSSTATQHQQQRWLSDHVRLASTAHSSQSQGSSSHHGSGSGSGSSSAPQRKKKKKVKRKVRKTKRMTKAAHKLIVQKEYTADQSAKLAAAFDELARKEGFGSEDAFFAKSATFEDDFPEDAFSDDGVESEEENDGDEANDDDEFVFDPDSVDLSDFEDGSDTDDARKDDDFIAKEFEESSMAERIASAQRDMDLGRVSVPEDLDRLARDSNAQTLHNLGFQRELDPWRGDETPRNDRFKILTNAMNCPACGADFQSHSESRPGFLPKDKFEIQQKLSKIEEIRKLQQRASEVEWSPEDEIEWLIQTGGKAYDQDPMEGHDLDSLAEKLGLDMEEVSKKKVICKRCHGLQHSGTVEASLRPGWSEDPLLAQSRFRELLRPISQKKAVIVALVDLFDFSGSVLPELDSIAGENPVIVAANKADLLPDEMGPVRAGNWVRRELEYMGIKSLANMGGAVRLVSCKTGQGVFAMLDKARTLAQKMDCDIYVVGAANAGKSTLLNYILRKKEGDDDATKKRKKRSGNKNMYKAEVTTSPLPGTTLKFIKVELEGGKALYDTPGLLVPGTLTQMLTPEELKIVIPKKQVEPITFRVENGKCVLIGGLARIALVGESRPFLFTFFVANEIKLHKTDMSRADEFCKKHAGELLTPPLPPGPERLEELGEFEHHVVDIEGSSWKEASADIALTGLGWVAVTGPGAAKVQISVPKGISVSVRPPLMPFDVWQSTARYTGGRAVRRTTKTKRGKGRRGVGRN